MYAIEPCIFAAIISKGKLAKSPHVRIGQFYINNGQSFLSWPLMLG